MHSLTVPFFMCLLTGILGVFGAHFIFAFYKAFVISSGSHVVADPHSTGKQIDGRLMERTRDSLKTNVKKGVVDPE